MSETGRSDRDRDHREAGRTADRADLPGMAQVEVVLAGYGADVDVDVIRAWWSLRSLLGVRWLVEHGYDPSSPGSEVDVLRSRM